MKSWSITGTKRKGALARAVLFMMAFSSAKERERRQAREVEEVLFAQDVMETMPS